MVRVSDVVRADSLARTPEAHWGEFDHGEEDFGELAVAGGYAAEGLELA